MSEAYRCEACGGVPGWSLLRRGDAVRVWSCDADVDAVLTGLQLPPDSRGGTEVIVRRSVGEELPHEMCVVCRRWTWCARQTEERPAGCDADDNGRRESDKRTYR